jgi:hypothetical protein
MDTAGHSNLRFHSASALICGGLAALLWDAGAPLLRALLLLGGAWAVLNVYLDLLEHYEKAAVQKQKGTGTAIVLSVIAALVPLAVLLKIEGAAPALEWFQYTPSVPLWLIAGSLFGGVLTYQYGAAWAEERHRSKKYGTPPEALGFQLATLACVAAALAWFMYASVSGDVKDRRTDLETARHLDQYHEADIYAADLKSAEGRLVPRVAAYLLLGACGYAGFLLGIKHYRARRAAAGDFPPKNS